VSESPTPVPLPADNPVARLVRQARAVMDGLAVTLTYFFRPPTTIQYPDRIPRPIVDTLPERYRGFLEVDLSTCTACKACERDCPIGCIAIDLEKVGDVRAMTRFDIDMGKCMYCNICVESCPVPNRAPGDAEDTKCIRMTREFEGATSDFSSLTFRFVEPGAPAPAYKHTKGSVPATTVRGQIARAVRGKARAQNPVAVRWSRVHKEGGALAELLAHDVVQARAEALAARVASGRDPAALLVEEALARTDCGSCGWPTCTAYAEAIASGKERSLHKCVPGGARSTRDVNLLVQLRSGATPAAAAETAMVATLRHHR